MSDTRTRRQKLEAMAQAVESPNEAAIARAKLATMGASPPPPRPPAPPLATPDPQWPGSRWAFTTTTGGYANGTAWVEGNFFIRVRTT